VAQLGELTIDAVAATTCLVTELQPFSAPGEPLGQLADVCRRIGDLAEETDSAVAAVLGDTDGNANLVNVQTDIGNGFLALLWQI